ncbi:hypothetical protein FH972_022439 [Carpinus fangiana]|uniref:Uncharacterized protein n=1 Tax=Carpinus fangiana TaxID=176857 RepID=A0A5N6KST8_9ROSI|nr:hypothetical protein FH972_022439 [Carpinus fangiana]
MSAATKALPASTLPPALPTYILRGHACPVHALTFFHQNSRLASGDADGYIVVWSVSIKRPVVVWQAHAASILGIQSWGDGKLISQGRDGKILVWAWSNSDEISPGWSTVLPAEQPDEHRRHPWLLHTLDISTLNFCSFVTCPYTPPQADPDDREATQALLVAVAGAKDSEIEIYQLPGQQQKAVITGPLDNAGKAAGMVMALQMFDDSDKVLTVLAAYENGQTCIFKRVADAGSWLQTYSSKPHTQPVLSLDMTPTADCYFTSAADGIVARHPLSAEVTAKELKTRHPGQQGLRVRSDGEIFATAGWDAHARVYSAAALKELAALKWHKEGCYSIAFATIKVQADASADAVTHTRTVAQTREEKAQTTHWLAVGSKDGKISLWDIY